MNNFERKQGFITTHRDQNNMRSGNYNECYQHKSDNLDRGVGTVRMAGSEGDEQVYYSLNQT